MQDFSKEDSFNRDSAFRLVRIGADCPVLETELNEAQKISEDRVKNLIQSYLGEGIFGVGEYVYDKSEDTFSISNEDAIIDGVLIHITNLSKNLGGTKEVYLGVKEVMVSYTDTIPYLGNEQETRTVPNKILDERIGVETSKRLQYQYNLYLSGELDSQDPSFRYIQIGQVTDDNEFKLTCNVVSGYKGSQHTEEFDITTGSRRYFTMKGWSFRMNTKSLLVFVDDKPVFDYIEESPNCISFKDPPKGKVLRVIGNNIIKVNDNPNNHNTSHMVGGDDPLDISDLGDKNNLLDTLFSGIGKLEINCGNLLDYKDSDTPDTHFYNCGTLSQWKERHA